MNLNKTKLSRDLYNPKNLKMISMRDGFGRALSDLGEEDNNVVALCADVAQSTRVDIFKKRFPDRYVELGVAEQNLAAVASGMANYGKIPFMVTYASFSPGRNYEQIRTLIALSDLPVKVIGSHAGISVGPDGATHQALEDIALMRVLPNMQVICPCDSLQAYKATLEIAKNKKPTYLRLARLDSPVFTTEKTDFTINKAQVIKSGKDVSIVACGIMVYQAVLASKILQEQYKIDAEIINCHTIKPLDEKTILGSAKKTGLMITIEDHQRAGGLGSAIAEVLAEKYPIKMKIMGINDVFGQSGQAYDLIKHYKLWVDDIVNNCLNFKKNN